MIHLRPCAIIAALLFCSACSTVSTRVKERPEAFAKLSPDDQTLVQLGKIENGFSTDAVYLAWGKADKIAQTAMNGKPSETWTYIGYRQETIPHYEVIPQAVAPGVFVPNTIYSPIYVSHPYTRRWVTFQNGKVVAWRVVQLP